MHIVQIVPGSTVLSFNLYDDPDTTSGVISQPDYASSGNNVDGDTAIMLSELSPTERQAWLEAHGNSTDGSGRMNSGPITSSTASGPMYQKTAASKLPEILGNLLTAIQDGTLDIQLGIGTMAISVDVSQLITSTSLSRDDVQAINDISAAINSNTVFSGPASRPEPSASSSSAGASGNGGGSSAVTIGVAVACSVVALVAAAVVIHYVLNKRRRCNTTEPGREPSHVDRGSSGLSKSNQVFPSTLKEEGEGSTPSHHDESAAKPKTGFDFFNDALSKGNQVFPSPRQDEDGSASDHDVPSPTPRSKADLNLQ